MEIISGKVIADEIKTKLKNENQTEGLRPCLAIINVGDDKENLLYIGLKDNALISIGGYTRIISIPKTADRKEVIQQITLLNQDENIDGILLQLPLPSGLQPFQEDFLEAIEADKDVDGFNPCSRGRMMGDHPAFISCAAMACMEVCRRYIPKLSGKRVLLVGDSFDLIQPLSIMFLKESCQLLLTKEYRPQDMDGIDIAVIEKGIPKMLQSTGIKDGALIIDAGFYYEQGKVFGNVDKEAVSDVNGYLLPVPGGLGPILIAKLLENVCHAARDRKDLRRG